MLLPPAYVSRAHTEALHAIEAAERRWAARHPINVEPQETLTWLRAARASWVAGDPDEAAVWYRRAAEGLLIIALQAGDTTGTFAYYGELAVGAALAMHEPVLQRVLDHVRMHTSIVRQVRRLGRLAGRPGDPGAAAQAIVSGWAAYLRGAQQDAADLLRMAERETRTMPFEARTRWQSSHWADLQVAAEEPYSTRIEDLEADWIALAVAYHDLSAWKLGELVDVELPQSGGPPIYLSGRVSERRNGELPVVLVRIEGVAADALTAASNEQRRHVRVHLRLPLDRFVFLNLTMADRNWLTRQLQLYQVHTRH